MVGIAATFRGGAAGDEPRAVVVASDVLEAGGNAVDAAVALYFAAAVTYPSSASLGGGGACLVFDVYSNTVEALDFPAIAPAEVDPEATRRTAVPGAVRGMYALHARYGRLKWRQVLFPAEELARGGHRVSRAFAHDLALAAGPLFRDRESARLFAGPNGGPLLEGQRLIQLDLAAVIAQIRTRGAGVFYNGGLARQMVAAVKRAGGSLSADDLRNYAPVWREPAGVEFGYGRVYAMPPPTAGGIALLQMWAMLTDEGRYDDASEEERGHLLAEIAMRVSADRESWQALDENGRADLITEDRIDGLMAGYSAGRHQPAGTLATPPGEWSENPAGTGFVVVDGVGSAVACTITLNNLFGAGRMAPDTGIVLAAPSPVSTGGVSSPSPAMIIAHESNLVAFAGAASGGASAPSALVQVMSRVVHDATPLAGAIAAPRLHHAGAPDVTVHEPELSAARRDGLASRGHALGEVPELGRVNAVICGSRYVKNAGSCAFGNDRRGSGLAMEAGS